MDEHTVGTLARLAGVSVRTLHHYDEIGLVQPGRRSDTGYRLYGDGDVERLQEVLFYRELGMPLADIASVMADPSYDRHAALLDHRRLLLDRRDRTDRLIRAVEAALAAHEKGIAMDAHDKLEVFGDFDPDAHADEAGERWGDTEAYRESQRRTSQYTKDHWLRIKAEAEDNVQRFAMLLRDGAPPDGTAAMDAAEEHRRHISRWFYECTTDIHTGLAQMYTDDARFREHYDQHEPGLADFVRAAIEANAARVG